MKEQALHRVVEPAADGIAAVVEQMVVEIDVHRADIGTRSTQRAGVRQVRPVAIVPQMRGDD